MPLVTIDGRAYEEIAVKRISGTLAVSSSELTSINSKLPALVNGKIPVDASVSISGGATEAKQDVGNTSLSSIAGFQIPAYDNLALTYRTSGNGTGKIDQVVFKTGASTVGTLTLVYDASNRLSTVTKS